MSVRAGLGIVVAAVVVLTLVGVVITREERREADSAPPAPHHVPRGSTAMPDVDSPPETPVSDPTETAPDPDTAEPKAHKHRRGYRAFHAKNPSGVLEVLVLLARDPLADATVRVRATQRGEVFESTVPGSDERVASTGDDGFARFDGLPPAYYMIGVQTSDGRLVTTYQLLRPGRETSRQVVALGACGLMGHVYALDGKPHAASRVLVSVEPKGGAPRVSAVTTTDADGSYRLSGWSEGRGRVYSQLGRSIDFELKGSDWQRADFGSPVAPVRWHGTLRGISGAPCDAVNRVVASEIGDGEGYAVDVGAAGAFELLLPPANYRLWAAAEREIELGNVELKPELAGTSLERDLTVPGVLLSGRVTAIGDRVEAGAEVEIGIERADDATSRRTCTARAGERYSFAGLESGKWIVTTAPLELLGARAKGLEVVINDTRDHATLDSIVSAP